MKHLSIFIVLIAAFSSCKKVIDLNLHDSEPVLVIEATITKDSLLNWALLTKSMNFNDNTSIPFVEGAAITLDSDNGASEQMKPITPGVYSAQSIRGEEGTRYTITVDIDNRQYKAVSTIPTQVMLDSLTCKKEFDRGKTTFQITPHYQDPAGVANYYKFGVTINGRTDQAINIRNDKYYDGVYTSRPIRTNHELKEGDTVRVEMECVDDKVYLFYYSLQRSQSMASAAPANPVSNFSGGCLGCFRGRTVQTMKLVVK